MCGLKSKVQSINSYIKKTKIFRRIIDLIRNSFLPVIIVIYFLLFHYANNVSIVSFSRSFNIFLIFLGIAILISFIFYFIFRGDFKRASIGASIFLIFFLTYGLFYDWLSKINIILIKHYSLLPLILSLGLCLSFLINYLNQKTIKNLYKALIIIFPVLIGYNLVRIIPAEISKAELNKMNDQITISDHRNTEGKISFPDIYYIILDEAAGFDVARNYFDYDQVDTFVEFLDEKGFYVAENSQATYPSTLYQLSSIFNYEPLPYPSDTPDYFLAISDNKVVRYLREKGYQIVVLNEMRSQLGYPTMPKMNADLSLSIEGNQENTNMIFNNEFVRMLGKQTMLRPLFDQMEAATLIYENHANTIYFAMEKIGNISEVSSPKFVYFHLLIPHVPFMFNHLGFVNDQNAFYDWNYYLDNYRFSLRVAESMIRSIFSASDPDKPPIIILQSDHGARNIPSTDPYHHPLEDYPEEYASHIINAIYLPHCDEKLMSQDMNPINTFSIIFNCLFDEEISIR